jgi:hypothetical protein
MLRRIMAPAPKIITAIDISNFVVSIANSNYAIQMAIKSLKDEFFGGSNGGFV